MHWQKTKKSMDLQTRFRTYLKKKKKDTDILYSHVPQFSACIERKLQGVHSIYIIFKSLRQDLNTAQTFIVFELNKFRVNHYLLFLL